MRARPQRPLVASAAAPPLLRRMGCWAYDGVLAIAVIALPSLLFTASTHAGDTSGDRHGLQAVVFFILALYFGYFWHHGQTLAMKTWRLRIVDRATGTAPGWPRALLRYVLAWLWFLPPLLILAPTHVALHVRLAASLGWVVLWALLSHVRSDRQFWHDAWAGTRVIDLRAEHAVPASPAR